MEKKRTNNIETQRKYQEQEVLGYYDANKYFRHMRQRPNISNKSKEIIKRQKDSKPLYLKDAEEY